MGDCPEEERVVPNSMKLFFKILFAPIWIPLKLLWFTSKVIAFLFLLAIISAIVYIFFFFH
jgi:hypothetical protein